MTPESAESVNAAQHAIRGAHCQAPFDDPQSEINRRVRAALLALEQRHAAVLERFGARAAGRRAEADAKQPVALAAAVEMLDQTRTGFGGRDHQGACQGSERKRGTRRMLPPCRMTRSGTVASAMVSSLTSLPLP